MGLKPQSGLGLGHASHAVVCGCGFDNVLCFLKMAHPEPRGVQSAGRGAAPPEEGGSKMAPTKVEAFRKHREAMNTEILAAGNLEISRFFALDSRCYEAGALPVRTKELLGLVASTVLRCNDCISYHVIRCVEEGIPEPEIHEALSVALVVGGSIAIPHLRHAFEILAELRAEGEGAGGAGPPTPGPG